MQLTVKAKKQNPPIGGKVASLIIHRKLEILFSNVEFEIHQVKTKQFMEFCSKADFQLRYLKFFT